MKRMALILVFIILATATLLLGGCNRDAINGNIIDVTITMRNLTEYEFEAIWFDSPPRVGATSPIHEFLTEADEVLGPGEERELSIYIFENSISSGHMRAKAVGIEEPSAYYRISLEGVRYIDITSDGDMRLVWTGFQTRPQ